MNVNEPTRQMIIQLFLVLTNVKLGKNISLSQLYTRQTDEVNLIYLIDFVGTE